ncbi:MAG: hypothetical protein NVV68_06765 [Dokdonella sp.]|nr:hypothetical protein [Dokdonella sp.]
MSLLPSTHKNNLTRARGIAYFAPFNADGTEQAQIPMSPSAEMTFSQEPETTEYISAESGLNELLDRTVLAVPRTISLTCNNLSNEIKALYFVAQNTPVDQASGTVTAEVTPYVFPNRVISLGGTTNSGSGVFGVSAVTVEIHEGATAPARVAEAAYEVGDVYVPAVANQHWYLCTVAGESADTLPTFTTNGTTFADGTATFIDMGTIVVANTDGVDFEVDEQYGLISIPTTGGIAAAVERIPAALRAAGRTLRLSVDYTRASASFDQLVTREDANLEGAFYFIEQNPKGTNTRWKCPRTSLSPTGDFATKSGTDYGAAEFEIGVLKPPVGAAMYQNGVPLG